MLVSFSIKNFLSFYDKSTISFQSKGAVKSHYDNYVNMSNKNIMKVSSIFGANASGKSNFLNAIDIFTDFINEGTVSDSRYYSYFHNNEDTEVIFEFLNKKHYFYKLIVCKYGIKAEHLEYKNLSDSKKTKPKTIFKIENSYTHLKPDEELNTINVSGKIKLGEDILKNSLIKNQLALKKRLSDSLDSDKLLFKLLSFYVGGIVSDAYSFFEKIVFYNKIDDEDCRKQLVDNHDLILEFVKLSDNNIIDFDYNEQEKFDLFYKYPSGKMISAYEQSNGTNSMIHLAPIIIDVLNKGGIMLVDEIDNSFHTQLVKALIYIFNSNEININNAQLLFSTHNQMLLDNTLFRSDQIWFTEKDSANISRIDCLKDIDPTAKNTTSYLKAYFRGEYGSIPYYDIDDLEALSKLVKKVRQHE